MAVQGEETLLQKVEKDIRAVLMSEKGGIALHRVDKDFRSYCDPKGIPYRKLGFSGVEELLTRMPSVCRLTRGFDGVIMVNAVATQETMHVARLVGGQKERKNRKKRKIPKIRQSQMSSERRPASSYSNRNYGRPSGSTMGFMGNVHSRFVPPRLAMLSAPSPYSSRAPPQQSKSIFGNDRGANNHYVTPAQRNPNPAPTGPSLFQSSPKSPFQPVTSSFGSQSVKTSEAVVKDRIVEVIENLVHGIHVTRLPKLYEEKYKEAAPSNIMAIAEKNMQGRIVIDRPHPDHVLIYPLLKTTPNQTGFPVKQISRPTPKPTVAPVHNQKDKFTTEPLPPIGESLAVGVVHIVSLDSFFVQTVDSQLLDLAQELQVYYAKTNRQANLNFKVGDCCAALFKEDRQWYRAEVLSIRPPNTRNNTLPSPNEPSCRVLFVDYGNQEKVSLNEMRTLAPHFFDLPTQSIQCGLDGVVPLNRSKHDKEAIDRFHTLALDQESVIEVKEHVGSLIRVSLQVNNENISIKLIKDKVVIGTPDYTKEATTTPGDSLSDSDSLASESVGGVTSPFANRLNSLSFDEVTSYEGQYVGVPPVEDTNEDFVDVFVTNINSTADFQFILKRPTHSDAMQKLEKKMFGYYTDSGTNYKVDAAVVGSNYAAFGFDNHRCYRVTVKSVDGDQCTVELLDKGTVVDLDIGDLRQLHSSFLKLPFQQISCSLHGITDSLDTDLLSVFHDLAYSKVLVAFIVERPNTSNDQKCVVELLQDDISINEQLAARQTSVDDLKPSLPGPSTTKNVFLSHITDDGVFYIRCPGPGMLRSDQLMDEILEYFSANPAKASDFVSKPEPGDLVWARYSKDSTWYRALIEKVDRSKREATIHFVDYGNNDVVKTTCLRKPRNAAQLNAIPHQAIKCRLADWPKSLEHVWSEEFGVVLVDRLGDSHLEIEVVTYKTSEDGIPFVKFYHSTPETGRILYTSELLELLKKDGTISGVVNSLCDDSPVTPSPTTKQSDTSLPSIKQDNSFVTQASSSTPHVSSSLFITGDWLDVFVAHVSSPGYFSVHLYSSFNELEKLKAGMSTYYDNVADEERFPVPEIGAECAVYDLDGDTWCRAVILEISTDKVTVFYSDWAMSKVTTANNLRALQPEFKELPYQGIVCSLSGVSSKISSNWPSRAVRRFIELVTGDCAFVMKINKVTYSEEQLPFKMKLFEVDFFDTRSPRNICLNEVLIDEGYANRIA